MKRAFSLFSVSVLFLAIVGLFHHHKKAPVSPVSETPSPAQSVATIEPSASPLPEASPSVERAPSEVKAPGFFRVAQGSDGRWWFVDPHGKAFFSRGITEVNPLGDQELITHRHPFDTNNLAEFGDLKIWAKNTSDRLGDWGFNTIGAWSSMDTISPYLGSQFAYTPMVACQGHLRKINQDLRYNFPTLQVNDYFSPDFEKASAEAAAEVIHDNVANDPNLLGYFLGNEMNWGHDYRSFFGAMHYYIKLPADAPGKAALVTFLQKKHGTIGALNEAWNTHFKSWEHLAKTRMLSPLEPRPAGFYADDSDFLKLISARFFVVCANAVRKLDPNHLILGTRDAGGDTQPEVLKSESQVSDIISVNFYEWNRVGEWGVSMVRRKNVDVKNWLKEYYDLGKRPILISEYGFRAFTQHDPGWWHPLFTWCGDQKCRSEGVKRYAKGAMSSPWIVGEHFFDYADQPFWGRPDGENNNWGLVDIFDHPYPEMVDTFKQVNGDIQSRSENVGFPTGAQPLAMPSVLPEPTP